MEIFGSLKLLIYDLLHSSGEADDATMALLNKPRCGERDLLAGRSRHKRYILLNRRWQRARQIDIQFGNYTADMSISDQEAIMQHVVDVSLLNYFIILRVLILK